MSEVWNSVTFFSELYIFFFRSQNLTICIWIWMELFIFVLIQMMKILILEYQRKTFLKIFFITLRLVKNNIFKLRFYLYFYYHLYLNSQNQYEINLNFVCLSILILILGTIKRNCFIVGLSMTKLATSQFFVTGGKVVGNRVWLKVITIKWHVLYAFYAYMATFH